MAKILEPWNKNAKMAMIENELTPKKLAEELRVSKGSIYNLLNKSQKEYPATLLRQKVSKRLGILTPDEMELNNKKSL